MIDLFKISDSIQFERFSSCSGCDETAEDDFDKRLEARAEASKRQLQKLSWPEDTHTAVLEIQVAKMLITRLGSLKPIRFCAPLTLVDRSACIWQKNQVIGSNLEKKLSETNTSHHFGWPKIEELKDMEKNVENS